METYLTADQLAERLSVGRTTVYRLMGRGMPSVKIAGVRRFRPSDVELWLENRQGVAA